MSIYLDCNATTPTEPEVVEKIKQYLTTDFGNEGSHTHSYGSTAKKAVQEAKQEEQKTVIQAGLTGAERLISDVEKRVNDKQEDLQNVVVQLHETGDTCAG